MFLYIVEHFILTVSVFVESLFTCGFLCLFKTLLKYQCFQKNSDYCKREFVIEITFAYFKVKSKLNKAFIHPVLPQFWWSIWLNFSWTRLFETVCLQLGEIPKYALILRLLSLHWIQSSWPKGTKLTCIQIPHFLVNSLRY